MHLSARRGELCQAAPEGTEDKKAGVTRNRGKCVCWLRWEKGIGISEKSTWIHPTWKNNCSMWTSLETALATISKTRRKFRVVHCLVCCWDKNTKNSSKICAEVSEKGNIKYRMLLKCRINKKSFIIVFGLVCRVCAIFSVSLSRTGIVGSLRHNRSKNWIFYHRHRFFSCEFSPLCGKHL